ncbi:MAG: ATP-binding protein [Acidobacteriia bacterium]|nr:ATP-binding protein [Terriglobia bacterium]
MASQQGSLRRLQLHFVQRPGVFEFEVSDACAEYNPLLRPDPNLDVPLLERKAGGLGVFLVKQLADEVEYARRDDRNHFWFRKRLEPKS